MLIPLGPDGGAAQLPGQDEIGGPEAASTIKGAHMLVDSYAALFGLTEADLTRLGPEPSTALPLARVATGTARRCTARAKWPAAMRRARVERRGPGANG